MTSSLAWNASYFKLYDYMRNFSFMTDISKDLNVSVCNSITDTDLRSRARRGQWSIPIQQHTKRLLKYMCPKARQSSSRLALTRRPTSLSSYLLNRAGPCPLTYTAASALELRWTRNALQMLDMEQAQDERCKHSCSWPDVVFLYFKSNPLWVSREFSR